MVNFCHAGQSSVQPVRHRPHWIGNDDPTIPTTRLVHHTILRRPTEAGPRIFNQDVDTWYLSGGFDGDFEVGGRTMYWDVTGIRVREQCDARPSSTSSTRACINVALGDPAVCAVDARLRAARHLRRRFADAARCSTSSPTPGVDTSSQKLVDVTANLSGDLFDLPAGALGFAIGYEHREEDGSFVPDPVVAAGETADVPTNPTRGRLRRGRVLRRGHRPDPEGRASRSTRFSFSAAARVLGLRPVRERDRHQILGELGPDREPDVARELCGRIPRAEHRRAVQPRRAVRLRRSSDPVQYGRQTPIRRPTARHSACRTTTCSSTRRSRSTPAATASCSRRLPRPSPRASPGTPRSAAALERLLVEANYYDIDIDDAIQAPDAQDTLDACIATLRPAVLQPGQPQSERARSRASRARCTTSAASRPTGVDINFDLAPGGVGRRRVPASS